MADISFLAFHDERGYYRLEGTYPNDQLRIDMTPEEADAWVSAQSEPVLQECPYCHQLHDLDQIQLCPLNPKNVVQGP